MTEETWSPVVGCTKCSPGCLNYNESVLDKPLHWRKPRQIFVCSMSDLFHPKVPFDFIDKVMDIIEECQHHTFQILTKHPHIMLEYFNGLGKRYKLSCCPNLWLGVTVCNQAEADEKIPILLQIPAAVRFVSIEPMLGEIRLNQMMKQLTTQGILNITKKQCKKE